MAHTSFFRVYTCFDYSVIITCVDLTAGGSPHTAVGAITGEASSFGNGNVPTRTTGKARGTSRLVQARRQHQQPHLKNEKTNVAIGKNQQPHLKKEKTNFAHVKAEKTNFGFD